MPTRPRLVPFCSSGAPWCLIMFPLGHTKVHVTHSSSVTTVRNNWIPAESRHPLPRPQQTSLSACDWSTPTHGAQLTPIHQITHRTGLCPSARSSRLEDAHEGISSLAGAKGTQGHPAPRNDVSRCPAVGSVLGVPQGTTDSHGSSPVMIWLLSHLGRRPPHSVRGDAREHKAVSSLVVLTQIHVCTVRLRTPGGGVSLQPKCGCSDLPSLKGRSGSWQSLCETFRR